jgi:putative DNA methylase
MSDTDVAAEPVRKRKLIEVALPLEAINRESAREKSIRHGHPSTLHLWWARRPLAAARAVLFAQLVDDPSSRPDEFPTEELQRKERDRLHALIERLVVWENIRDEKLLAEAHAEILKSTNGNPPPILDPFAGGGTIPLEAQRLGLEAHASDLNPVAVLINKALIEIPPKFRDQPPVFPGLAESEIRGWKGAEGLAADIRAYGAWMRDEAEKRIGHLYPKATLPDGSKATPIAWIWARTVVCPNPACAAEVPLVSSLDLRNKKGQEVWLRPVVRAGAIDFEVTSGARIAQPNKRGQGAKFECWICGAPVAPDHVHQELDVTKQPPHRLLTVITAGDRKRCFVNPTSADLAAVKPAMEAASVIRNGDAILSAAARGTFGGNAQGRRYGFFTFADYFTDRQLVALATLSDLVVEARQRVLSDSGSNEYSDAVATYLAMVISKVADRGSSLVTWVIERASTRNTFARQAISMAWDFVEANQLTDGTGSWSGALEWTCESLEGLRIGRAEAVVSQADATRTVTAHAVIATDPPYYDNISYSDLSDFFYVWLRRSLRDVHPELFSTVLVPKSDELVANSYRHGGRDGAKKFFEEGFRNVFAAARDGALDAYPISVWYAFKQSETSDDGTASSGWETLLEGMIRSQWEITSTWPMRGERGGRTISLETNALASAIVLTLRPRNVHASTTDRRGFISALTAELPDALRSLQQGQIAPVDLPQAAIGPGMAVFSRYRAVLEPDGSEMTVRSALSRINEVLDQVLNEQEGDFDSTSRFAIAWYRQHGYGTGKFGDADNLARARNTSVDIMDRDGILMSRAGNVALISPADLNAGYDVVADRHTSNWEGLHHLIRILEQDGIAAAGEFLRSALSREDRAVEADLVKELAHLLFRVAEGNGWTKDALSFNNLVTSWPEIFDAVRSANLTTTSQGSFDFGEDAD